MCRRLWAFIMALAKTIALERKWIVVRSRVLLMVALLAVAGVMAAMAYTSAEVNNPAEATIVRTDVALLALECADPSATGYKDANCEIKDDGRLHLNFAKGKSQPGGEPGEVDPVVVSVSEQKKGSGSGYTDRYYEVTLTDDEGHRVKKDTVKKKSYEIKDFESEIIGSCITYSYRAKVNTWGKNQWETVSGTLCIDDHKHKGEPPADQPGYYGFQPGSVYRFGDLVKVTNNSEDSVNITVELPEEWLNQSGMDIDVTADGVDLTNPSNFIRLGPGESTWINFTFAVPDNWADATGNRFPTGEERYPFGGTLVVKSVAVD